MGGGGGGGSITVKTDCVQCDSYGVIKHACSVHNNDLTTEHRFDSQAMVIDVLAILSMYVCTTRHWQPSCRLVPELNVCTVFILSYHSSIHSARSHLSTPINP